MDTMKRVKNGMLWAILLAVMTVFAGCAGTGMDSGVKVTLSGDQEVPPAKTAGSGSGTITVGADMSISGSVTTTGVIALVAHIHVGSAGKNGPVIIPLTKTADSTWSVPAGAKLTDAQYASYKAGDLYVNVHSAAYKGGEVRGQIKP
jgi:hypothetical protein